MPDEKQRTVEDVEARLAQIRMRTAEVELQRAEMELERTQETIIEYKAQKEGRAVRNRQRQKQLKIDINERSTTANKCTHRQGGSLANPYGGKGVSALQRVIMPDERELIMCAICTLRVFSPFPGDASRRRRIGESEKQAEKRVERYEQAFAEFEELRKMSMDKLTEEAATPMHCGKTFKFLDGDMNQVQVPAPCDFYAQGVDNRKGVQL